MVNVSVFRDFLIEFARERELDTDIDSWEVNPVNVSIYAIFIYLFKDIPKQANSNDCGVFVCQYVEYLSRNAPIDFTQLDVPALRKKMAYEIYTHKLLKL